MDQKRESLWFILRRSTLLARSGAISDIEPDQFGQPPDPCRTAFRRHIGHHSDGARKNCPICLGTLSDFIRNGVRYRSEPCPISLRTRVRIAPEYANVPAGLLARLAQGLLPCVAVQIIREYRLPLIPARHYMVGRPRIFNPYLPSHQQLFSRFPCRLSNPCFHNTRPDPFTLCFHNTRPDPNGA